MRQRKKITDGSTAFLAWILLIGTIAIAVVLTVPSPT